ncbi:uncharacterized protein LOC130048617 [Ostrea edulis]|uniref:uncharacterized protein LOC130048617 n=1 Tax=Ostrea edulis TaxID=37623 RepID=UPI0024AF6707|nr:uncharacterized protein LOC130048617 [Ostrea edulis]
MCRNFKFVQRKKPLRFQRETFKKREMWKQVLTQNNGHDGTSDNTDDVNTNIKSAKDTEDKKSAKDMMKITELANGTMKNTESATDIINSPATGHKQSDTSLNAVESLIYNNAEATVKLDSTELKQLIQLSTTDKIKLKKVKRRIDRETDGLGYPDGNKACQKMSGKSQSHYTESILEEWQQFVSSTFSRHKPRVSFSVYVKSKHLTLGKGQMVIYDGILTNDGNGYDDRSGIFTCPVAGTYMFVIDCLSNKPTLIQIILNKNMVGSAYISTTKEITSYQQLSRTVVLTARKGDHVKVANVEKGSFIYQGHYSGFSGTLLY